jgi:hypothetical protein
MGTVAALRLIAICVLIFTLHGCQSTATSSNSGLELGANAITIVNDQGGHVVGYAWQVKKANENDTGVRFAGRCDSACTLYLAAEKSCILPGATFGFHSPHGSDARGNRTIRRFMLNNYPWWVRNWLSDRGGLTEGFKVMPYAYASRFIPACKPQVRRPAI